MILHFLKLEWKQYFRSSYWQKSIGIKILMGFFALYFVAMFFFLGIGLFSILEKTFPDKDPFLVANGFLFFWVLGDLMARFFLQKLPIMSVKPLLTIPIKRSKIVNYVLGKSAISFFNFLPLFAIIPFGLTLMAKGYDPSKIITWMITLILLVLIINFLNFIIENLTAKTELSFLPLIVIAGILFALDHFQVVSFSSLISKGVLAIANNPLYLVIPGVIFGILYYYNYVILRSKLFVDGAIQTKIKEAKTSD